MSRSFSGFNDGDVQPILPGIANGRRRFAGLAVIDGQQPRRVIDHVSVSLLQTAVVVVMTDIFNPARSFQDALLPRLLHVNYNASFEGLEEER